MFLIEKSELEEMLKKIEVVRAAGNYPDSKKIWICPLCHEVEFSNKSCYCDNDL